jgi:hypothetical protein
MKRARNEPGLFPNPDSVVVGGVVEFSKSAIGHPDRMSTPEFKDSSAGSQAE